MHVPRQPLPVPLIPGEEPKETGRWWPRQQGSALFLAQASCPWSCTGQRLIDEAAHLEEFFLAVDIRSGESLVGRAEASCASACHLSQAVDGSD